MTVVIDADLNASASGGAAASVTVADDTTTNATMYPTWVTAATGDLPIKVSSTDLTWNPSTSTFAVVGGPFTNTQAVATTSTDGVVLGTSATATSGNQKYSPRLRLRGSYFSGSAKTTDYSMENIPTASGGAIVFSASDDGAAYTPAAFIRNGIFSVGDQESGNGTSGYIYCNLFFAKNGGNETARLGANQFNLCSTASIGFTNSAVSADSGAVDTWIGRAAAANIRMGAAAANPPVAQTLSVQNASGTDIAGSTWTHIASLGTGAGSPGTMVFQTGSTLGTGTTLQTAATRFTIAETRLTAAVPVVLPSYTVGTLPTGAAGMRAFCTDSNSTTFAAIVAGGGANWVPVYHDGTNWRIG